MADNPVMGAAACPLCGCKTAIAKEMKSGAYIVCPPEHDGGCNQQTMGRSKTAAVGIARKVTKWTSPEMREKYLPKTAAKPVEPEPAPVAVVAVAVAEPVKPAAPPPTPPQKRSIWDMPISDVLGGKS